MYSYCRYKPEIIFLDVGQGDASIIKLPNRQVVLIDGGPDWSVLLGLGKYLPSWQRSLQAIFISHFHHDHFIGLAEVLRRYKVAKVYYPPLATDDIAYQEFFNLLDAYNISHQALNAGYKIEFSSTCQAEVLWPRFSDLNGEDLNHSSLVLNFACQGQKMLFTGDVDKAVEKTLITQDKKLSVDILKSAHHGSNSANSWEFLQAVNPSDFVISVGKANRYGLPSVLVLERLKNLTLNMYRTDIFGDVVFDLHFGHTIDK